MSVAVCRSATASFHHLEKEGFVGSMLMPNRALDALPTAFPPSNSWSASAEQHQTSNPHEDDQLFFNNKQEEEEKDDDDEIQVSGHADEDRPGQFDIWSSIQSQKVTADALPAPYVHPLVRRSSSLLSQRSLEICTESLGSETGSDDFASSDDMDFFHLFPSKTQGEADEVEEENEKHQRNNNNIVVVAEPQQEDDDDDDQEEQFTRHGFRKELATVNYHCSISRRSPPRSFPPPLPSISRRDGPCLQMRPHRRNGRLVVEAVPVPSQNYLHAERQGGRLLLSFIDTTFHAQPLTHANPPLPTPPLLPHKETIVGQQEQEVAATKQAVVAESEEKAISSHDQEELEEEEEAAAEEEEEDEEEEVEVVDRGTMVEVKVSTQPQPQIGGVAAMKVHRSSIVINKFVGGTPLGNHGQWTDEPLLSLPSHSHAGRLLATTTTAAAAAVAASSVSASTSGAGEACRSTPSDHKLLFTSKRRNREELLMNMRRCSQLRRPLFIWEPCCIATSS